VSDETRRQRRDRRRAAGDGNPTPQPATAGAPAPAERAVAEHGPRGGFIRECWAELKKVDWPNRNQVIQGTVVVIIAVAIVGAFLWAADQVLQPFVRDILLGQ
jgi:preprotein translocase subunit SecE